MSDDTAEQIRAARKARRDVERAERDAEVAESRRVYQRVDEATARTRAVLPGNVGEAVAALLDATKPWRASDGHMSSSAVTRHSPEVLLLAEAILAAQPAPPGPNHGPLPDGGFWAGFCERCDTLGCPGDCDE